MKLDARHLILDTRRLTLNARHLTLIKRFITGLRVGLLFTGAVRFTTQKHGAWTLYLNFKQLKGYNKAEDTM